MMQIIRRRAQRQQDDRPITHCRYAMTCIIVFVAMLLGQAHAYADEQPGNVAFQRLEVPNGNEPPLDVGVWYPTRAAVAADGDKPYQRDIASAGAPLIGNALPLIVISHGGGGTFESHADTAIALAHAGMVVAAVSHRGDSGADQSQVLKLWRRPEQLERVISYMLDAWPQHARIDPRNVGAFGYSNGGFTVLVAAGGVPDLRKTSDYCRANPTHDLCRALSNAGVSPAAAFDHLPPHAWVADPRIKAIVVAAPAFGFAFDRDGLKRVRIPVQLWGAANDRHQPAPWFEDAVRKALPKPPEFIVVPGAGHYDFLPPCDASLAAVMPSICIDPTGFNRAAFHRTFNADVVRFFRDHLH